MAALPATSDAHRRFLQALMAQGAVEAARARKLHRLCCQIHEVNYAHDKLDDFVGCVNARLQPLFMEIRKGMAEEDGRTHYALVNLAETEITRLASDYSESERELFKETLDQIFSSESGFASSTAILNLADQLKSKKMKKMEAEQVLQRLVQDRWLQEREGEYTLTIRSILELEPYILRHYSELARKCHICHSLSVQRQTCGDCGTAVHLPCLAKFFRAQTQPRCPQCRQFWPHQVLDLSPPGPQPASAPPRERRRIPAAGPRQR